MGKSKWFFSMSGVILLDRRAGDRRQGHQLRHRLRAAARASPRALEQAGDASTQVRNALAPQGLGDAKIQTIYEPASSASNVVQISTKQLGPQRRRRGRRARSSRRFGARATARTTESIGPSFGQTRGQVGDLIAIIASLIVISIYIALRFEWKFAVPVLIALMHDILIVAGVYALVGREVTTSTVAALLTILGFSLYDTIIVFDRVRENIPRMPSAAFSQIVNRSMSEVIVALAGDELLHAAAGARAVLFGGETLKDFAFALLVGIASGTYSSIFIADAGAHALEGARAGLPRARARASARRSATCPPTRPTAQGGPVDVAPQERGGRRARRPRRRSGAGRLAARSSTRWSRDLGIEEARRSAQPAAARPRGRRGRPAAAARARAQRPGHRRRRGARRRRRLRRRRQRRRRAPKPREAAQPPAREAALMGVLVWVMVGLAIWHFTMFLPDRFWGGIVGAFLGALSARSSSG